MTESFRPEELLFMMKRINLNLTAQLELSLKSKNITGVQVYFLVYILRHHPKGYISYRAVPGNRSVKADAFRVDQKNERKRLSLFSCRFGMMSEKRKCSPRRNWRLKERNS